MNFRLSLVMDFRKLLLTSYDKKINEVSVLYNPGMN
jgi:hypothetical protein